VIRSQRFHSRWESDGAVRAFPEVQRTALARVAFPILAWGLAFHSFVIAILFGPLGLPEGTVRMIAGWKEVALVLLVSVVLIRAVTSRGPAVTLTWTDFWIGGLFTVAVIYLVAGTVLLGRHLPVTIQLLGLRQAVFFMLLYFVGRATPDLIDASTMRKIFILVIVTCVIGIIERFLVPPIGLVALGVAAYFQDFLGAGAMTVGNEFGLPTNYWAVLGGNQIRRAGSVFLSGQGFAVPFILFFPLVTTWVFWRPKYSVWQVLAFALISVALLLTITRMTIMVVMLQCLLLILMRRKPEWAVAGLALATMLFLAAMLLVPGFPNYVFHTLSGQEASTAGHIADWTNGALAFIERPWGFGLGTADQTATRAGLAHITGDNLYLTYAVQMGILGVGLLVLALCSITGHALNLFHRAGNETQRRMGAAIWLATIGLMINGMTAVVFSSITFGWLFFWLAGAVVTMSQKVTSPTGTVRALGITPAA
jgi:O-antigen ligase